MLFDAMDAQRAAQAYLWSLPLVGFAVWREEQARVLKVTTLYIARCGEKRGIVTANLTTPYIVSWTARRSPR